MSECLSANDAAIKLRADHKLKEGRDRSLVCAASSCPEEVREVCEERVKVLNAAIPHIVFEAKDPSGNDLSAVTVTMDGQPFVAGLDGTAIPVDPGAHAFTFTVAGLPVVEKRVVIYEGDKTRRERVELGGQAAAQPAAPVTPPQVRGAATPPSGGLGTARVVGLTVGSAGVVGVGVGAAFGLVAVGAWSDVKTACGPGGASRCARSSQATVLSDQSSAQTDGTVSTVAFIAGGVLLATGAVLWLTGGHHGHERAPDPAVSLAPTLGPDQAGFSLRGAF